MGLAESLGQILHFALDDRQFRLAQGARQSPFRMRVAILLAVVRGYGYGEGFFGFGPDTEVGVRFGEDDFLVLGDDVGGGDGKAPAGFAVDEGDVDEDGLVVGAVVFGDGVDEAEFFGDEVSGVGEDGEGQTVLAGHEVALAGDLRADGDHEAFALTEGAVEIAPGFKLGDAVGAPAAAEEFDDERTESEEVGRADEAAGGVFEFELRGEGADGKDFFFDAGSEELGDGALADGKALLLDEVAGVGGDLVELVLKCRHGSPVRDHLEYRV